MKKLLLVLALIQFSTLDAQVTLTLQPDAVDGKDALLASNNPFTNMGTHPDYDAFAWTNTGEVLGRSLVEFDLTSIPQGSVINNATLSLYHNPSSLNSGAQHQSLTGPNNTVIQRITSVWDEGTVTWDTQPSTTAQNEVLLAQTVNPTQDFDNINVTAMVQDMVDNPTASYGFLFKLQTEVYYRSVIFASSDCTDPTNHPKLVVNYTDVTGIGEMGNKPKELVKIIDMMGRETNNKQNTPLIYIYSDGSTKRMFLID